MIEPIWKATADHGVWLAEVQDTTNRAVGVLMVSRVADGEVILREEVPLAYGAVFGPDVDDVNMWQVMAIEAIDHYNAHHGKEAQDGRDQGRQGHSDQDPAEEPEEAPRSLPEGPGRLPDQDDRGA